MNKENINNKIKSPLKKIEALFKRIREKKHLAIRKSPLEENLWFNINNKVIRAVLNGDKETIQDIKFMNRNNRSKIDDDELKSLNSALIKAVINGSLKDVAKLIAQGADVNAKDGKGRTSLMYAVKKADINKAKLLINLGANIDAQDEHGFTALMFAVWKRYYSVAKLLIEYNADISLKNELNKTAYDMFRDYNNQNLLEFLKEHK